MQPGLRFSLLLLILACLGRAQSSAGDDRTDEVPRQMSDFAGVTVDSIAIDNRNIFDTDDSRYHHFIFKLANKLHYKTRTIVIRPEILLKTGKPFSVDLAEETARNLRRSLLVYDAWVEPVLLPDGRLLVRVVTIDQWSLSSGLNINRDGNRTRYDLTMTERKLLGNNQLLSARYVLQSGDRDYFTGHFVDERLRNRPYAVVLGFSNNPLNSSRYFSLSHPYYNLSQTLAFSFSVAGTSGRRDIHSDSCLIGESQHEGDHLSASVSWRTGSYRRKLQIKPLYVYRFERSFDQKIIGETHEDSLTATAAFPVDSMYHQVGASILVANMNFVTLTKIDGFGYTEDFTLGQAFQIGWARAASADFRHYVFDVLNIGLSESFKHGPNLVFIDYHGVLWFHYCRDIRRISRLTATYYHSVSQLATIAARGLFVSESRPAQIDALTLGGDGELRGYNEFFRTGNRKGVVNLEGRFYPGWEILSIRFGGVAFVDMATIWSKRASAQSGQVYTSIGAGLRLALERSSKRKLLRIDVAYSKFNGWQVSVGTNQYFDAQTSSFLLTTR